VPPRKRPSEIELFQVSRRLKSPKLIARHYGVHVRTIHTWLDHYGIESVSQEERRIFDAVVEEFDVTLRVRERIALEEYFRRFTGRIGAIADTHAPLADRDTIEAFLSLGPYDLLVINGDLWDWSMFGRHVRDSIASAEDTYWAGVEYVRALSQSAKQTVVIAGNHDNRLDKAILRNLDIETLKQIQAQGYTSAIKSLVKEVDEKIVAVEDFRMRIADILFSHHETGGVPAMSGAVRAAEAAWNEHNYEKHPFRMVVHAHAHTEIGMMVHRRFKMMSTGTASILLPYVQIGKGTRNPWYCGFGVIEAKNGVAQYNSSRAYCVKILGAEDDTTGFEIEQGATGGSTTRDE
jgi:predicted phosphodiesterase